MHMPEANRLDQVADVVREVIRRVRPANVDEAAITRTGEGPDVSIILVPHRALGGLAVGLWADAKGVQLFWAKVGDLSYHDDIDLGITIGELPWADDWEKQLVVALETELRRPINLRSRKRLLRSTLVSTVSSDRKERSWRVGTLPGGASGQLPAATQLGGSRWEGPSFPVPLEEWRRWSEPL